MRKIKLTASDGDTLTGRLPESWAEVPWSPYVALAATAQPVPACIPYPTAHLYASVAGCQALARLLDLPPDVLQQDVSRLVPIYEAAPWLFVGPLPLEQALVTTFTHHGIRYRYAGQAELGADAAAVRERVLLWYLREADGNVVACAPHLLATLYTPGGAPLTAASQAFESLPLSIVWPCLLHFMLPEMPQQDVQRYLLLRPMLAQALHALEQALATAPAPRRSPALLRWLGRVWRK